MLKNLEMWCPTLNFFPRITFICVQRAVAFGVWVDNMNGTVSKAPKTFHSHDLMVNIQDYRIRGVLKIYPTFFQNTNNKAKSSFICCSVSSPNYHPQPCEYLNTYLDRMLDNIVLWSPDDRPEYLIFVLRIL